MPSVMATMRGMPASSASENGIGGKWRRNKDHGGVGAGLLNGVGHRVEDGPAFVRGSTFAGSYTTNNLSAVFGSALGVEGSFLARYSLHNEPRVLID